MTGELLLPFVELIKRDPVITVLIGAVVFVITRALRAIISKNRLPPGPLGVPFLGYLPFLTWYGPWYVTMTELAKRYGDVYRIQIGWQKIIVLSKAEVIEEAFELDAFCGRDKESIFVKIWCDAGKGQIVFNDGYKWRFNRKIALRTLSIFSSSKTSQLEDCIRQNLDWLQVQIKNQGGKPFNPKECITKAMGAILSSIAFGVTSTSPESPFFERLIELAELANENRARMMFLEFLPPLSLFYRAKVKEMNDIVRSFVNHVMAEVDERIEDLDIENVGNLLSSVEKAIRETSESEKISAGMREEEMRRIVLDIFDGGYFTIGEIVQWSCLLLAQNQTAQEQMAKEVLEVVGTEGYPSLALHLKDLQWTKAVFYETLRFSTILPFGIPHLSLATVEFHGYIIPKGTQVLANFWAQNRNPKTFPDPDNFKPERFIYNGKFVKHLADKVGGFGVGKRQCIGEGLAMQQISIVIAAVVQRFRISLDPETKIDPAKNAIFRSTILPAPHKLIFVQRT